MATEASNGPSALQKLSAGLNDQDPSVRYWAATGIGNIGTAAADAQPAIKKALIDTSPSVRIAAARAAAKLGETRPQAIRVLEQELASDHQWGRLAAAIVSRRNGRTGPPRIASTERRRSRINPTNTLSALQIGQSTNWKTRTIRFPDSQTPTLSK